MKYKYIGPKPSGSRLLDLAGTYSFNISFDTQVVISRDGIVLNPSPKLESIIFNNSNFINLTSIKEEPVIVNAPAVEEVIDTPEVEGQEVVVSETPKRKGGRPPKSK